MRKKVDKQIEIQYFININYKPNSIMLAIMLTVFLFTHTVQGQGITLPYPQCSTAQGCCFDLGSCDYSDGVSGDLSCIDKGEQIINTYDTELQDLYETITGTNSTVGCFNSTCLLALNAGNVGCSDTSTSLGCNLCEPIFGIYPTNESCVYPIDTGCCKVIEDQCTSDYDCQYDDDFVSTFYQCAHSSCVVLGKCDNSNICSNNMTIDICLKYSENYSFNISNAIIGPLSAGTNFAYKQMQNTTQKPATSAASIHNIANLYYAKYFLLIPILTIMNGHA